MIDYFRGAFQRSIIIKPLTIGRYTSMLDVDIWVKGGGSISQAKA